MPAAARGARRTRCRPPAGRTCGTTPARPPSAVTRHREHPPAAVAVQARTSPAATAPEPVPLPAAPRTGPIADRTRARHADVRRLLAGGRSFGEIAAEPGPARTAVR